MNIIFLCADVDTITVGTKCHTSFTNKDGVVVEVQSDMRDLDGSYGIGYVVKWTNSKSWIAKSEITAMRPGAFVFNGENN